MLKGKRADRPDVIEKEPAPVADTAPSDAPAAAPAANQGEKTEVPAAGSSSSGPAAAPAADTTIKTYEKVIVKETEKHEFTIRELAEIADRMAQAAAKVYQIEREKSEAAAHWSAELKAANLAHGSLVEKYNLRYEMREVECRVEWDTPETGYKSLVSTEDGHTVKEVKMTDAEKQRAFVFDAGDGKPQ